MRLLTGNREPANAGFLLSDLKLRHELQQLHPTLSIYLHKAFSTLRGIKVTPKQGVN